MNGLVGSTSAADLDRVDRDERVGLALRIIGPQVVSSRMAASMVEIDRTISTWPQLASDVTLGGASVTAAVRRIGLGQPMTSGRRSVDLEDILSDPSPAPPPSSASNQLTGDANKHYSATGLVHIVDNVPEFIRFVVEHATLAPSGGNCQPWSFYFDDQTLWVVHDRKRSTTLLDRRAHAALLALGAAIENIAIAAAHRQHRTHVVAFPRPEDNSIVAAIRFEQRAGCADPELADLFAQLAVRVTNRRLSVRSHLQPGAGALLMDSAKRRGAHLQLVTEDRSLDEVGRILGASDRVRFTCRELHDELVGEVRWTPEDVERTRDGIDLVTLELSAAQAAAMRLLARPGVAALLRSQGGGSAIEELAATATASASAVGLLSLPAATPQAWLNGGRALQRVWLAATSVGLAFQPMTALLYMFEMLGDSSGTVFTDEERSLLCGLNERLERVFAQCIGATRAMLFRVAVAPDPTARSLRLPLERVLHSGRP